ncbi:GNAT family N-acetyltransferase [Maribellus sp. YY47]|uniref:GNAT family N-acetyltransferase n=1 Tax=Maribellus sp. YY47 TaxID=2929486 RepID=UPI002001C95C|nr:GNAT family N-acetyltransferase [Maribellus sp. YY47]MCK3686112.1 GNAT family N-acetyltransferase [Maribellus sp. YY47]
MEFQTLENLTINELTKLFNRAFEEYFVPINLTPEILSEKMMSEDVLPDHSMGMFTGGRPVGFMLHAIRKVNNQTVAYNAATGVLKAFRGQKATLKMYEQLIPLLRDKKVAEIELEVISENIPAIKSYTAAGFKKVATLECFKGKPISALINHDVEIREIVRPDFSTLDTFRTWEPSWQNASATLQKLDSVTVYGAYLQGELAGFLAGNLPKARILQFAVAPKFRRQKIGSTLFRYFYDKTGNEINTNNIDDPGRETQVFLEKIGMKHFLSQYKMKLNLNALYHEISGNKNG